MSPELPVNVAVVFFYRIAEKVLFDPEVYLGVFLVQFFTEIVKVLSYEGVAVVALFLRLDVSRVVSAFGAYPALLHNVGLEIVYRIDYAPHTRSANESLAVIAGVALGIDNGLVRLVQTLEQVLVGLAAALNPLLQLLLLLLLGLNHAEAVDTFYFTAVEFLHVAQAEEIVCILEPDGRVGLHPLCDDGHLLSAQLVGYRILHRLVKAILGAGRVTVGPSGITDYHRIVTAFVALARNLQLSFRLERHVKGRILRRLSVRGAVHAVNCKVALVLRPLPVVNVGTECGHAYRRRGNQPHVLVNFVQGDVIL